jgi:hypothetical protein
MDLARWTGDLGEEQWGLRLASVLFFFGMVVVSSIAPIGQNSDSHPVPINPAGYAFAIWFVIWLFQVGTPTLFMSSVVIVINLIVLPKGTGVVYGLIPGGSPAKLNGIEALGVYAPLGWLALLVWAALEFFQKVRELDGSGLQHVRRLSFKAAWSS